MSAPNHRGHQQPLAWGRIAIAVAAAALVVVWLLARGDGDDAEPAASGPVAATVAEIRELAGERGHPIYWLGERPDTDLELTETAEGNIYVRYLPPDAEIGDPTGDHLTVGTYPIADAYALTEGAGELEGAITGRTPDGGLVVTNENSPTSVYVAFPDSTVQIEVYDFDAERAMRHATSGDLQPVD